MDFSHHHLSDSSDEDSAVNDLLSQAKDHIVLEQLAAINCSSFTDDPVLPTHLESRLSKLKSFPATNPKSSSAATSATTTASFRRNENPDDQKAPDAKSQSGYVSPPLKSPELSPEMGSKPKQKDGSGSSRSISSPESATFSPAKRVSGKKQQRSKSKLKAKSGWLSSPLSSCNSMREDSPSPPRKAGCFWCSPKKTNNSANCSQRKSKENGIGLDFSGDDDLLAGLGSFSKREQSKILKKAMKEEEKISKEAEKIVKWAKQQSARMNVSGIVDELSD